MIFQSRYTVYSIDNFLFSFVGQMLEPSMSAADDDISQQILRLKCRRIKILRKYSCYSNSNSLNQHLYISFKRRTQETPNVQVAHGAIAYRPSLYTRLITIFLRVLTEVSIQRADGRRKEVRPALWHDEEPRQ